MRANHAINNIYKLYVFLINLSISASHSTMKPEVAYHIIRETQQINHSTRNITT